MAGFMTSSTKIKGILKKTKVYISIFRRDIKLIAFLTFPFPFSSYNTDSFKKLVHPVVLLFSKDYGAG